MKRFSSIVAVALLGAACGGNGGHSDDAGDPAIARGRMLAQTSACTSCHGPDYAGTTVNMGGACPLNITPDETNGIGGWTDAQIIAAVRTGVDDEGMMLSSAMPHFAFTDAQAADLVAFLRSLPPSSNDAEGMCPAP